MYSRFIREAMSIISSVIVSCGGRAEELFELVEALEEVLEGRRGAEDVEEIAVLLREYGVVLREEGCLDWYRLEEAAGILEQA